MGVLAVVLVIKDGLSAFKYFEDLEDEDEVRDEVLKATKQVIEEDKDLLNRLKDE